MKLKNNLFFDINKKRKEFIYYEYNIYINIIEE